MSIIKNKLQSNFCIIANALVTDKNISAKAYRVMSYLLTLPDGWEVNNTDVCKKLDICEDIIAKYWKELIKAGWITRYEQKRNTGKWASFEYHLNEVPILPSRNLPTLKNSVTEKSRDGETTALTNTHPCTNTHSTSNTHVNNEKNSQKRKNEEENEEEPKELISYTNQYGHTPTFIRGLEELEPLKPSLPPEPFQEVIDYFNEKTNSKFQNASITVSNLKRILEKHTVDEVKLVIDYISQDEWHIKLNRVVLPVICRPTLFAEKLAIATSHKNFPIKQERKFNDVGDFPEDSPVKIDYAEFLQNERDTK